MSSLVAISRMLMCYFVSVLLGATAVIATSGNATSDNCGLLRGNSTVRSYHLQIIGTDYDNLPVLLMPLGKWDLVWLVTHPEELKTFTRSRLQLIEETRSGMLFKRFTNQTWRTDSVAVIVDFNGLSLKQFFVEDATKLTLISINDLQRVLPEISYGFFINTNPLAHQILNLARPVASNLFERFEIHGTNSKRWIPQLVKKIPRSTLPLAIGGTKDFKPVATCEYI